MVRTLSEFQEQPFTPHTKLKLACFLVMNFMISIDMEMNNERIDCRSSTHDTEASLFVFGALSARQFVYYILVFI